MGFEKDTKGSSTFIAIRSGKLAVRCQANDEDAVPREIKSEGKDGEEESKTIWEQKYSSYTGHIVKVEVKESKNAYPDQLCIHVKDKTSKGKAVIIATQVDSGHAMHFYKVCRNLDLSLPVKFSPYDFVPEGEAKRKSGWNLWQSGGKLASSYEKDEIPAWTSEKKKVKGKKDLQTVWDSSAAFEWLSKRYEKWLKSQSWDDDDDSGTDDDDDDGPSRAKKGNSNEAQDDDDDGDYPSLPKKSSSSSKKSPGSVKNGQSSYDAMDDDDIPF